MQLPPCLVCGGHAPDSSRGFASTFDEAQATEVLGHAPPETASVVDVDGKRLWIGHGSCTGFTLRTKERSAEELRGRLTKRRERERVVEAYRLRQQAKADAPRRAGARSPVQVGMSRDQVRQLLGPPHGSTTLQAYLATFSASAVLGGSSADEYWLYRHVPPGRNTEIAFKSGRVVEVRTPRRDG
ncbi:hypothetical protein [Saccharothrix hoggarensis]|uniref:SmpA/OmlA family protein n=1 Tax=Saccharothrix hoggarensis TaxID=913853 RepID=A0ABW3QX39_9PSEU